MRLRVCILAAGAGGMYCGSCLRDNALAGALRRMGHKVTLIPLYTPLRTDSADASIDRVFYGGVNAYLQYATKLFRWTPRAVDWLFDRRWLLKLAGRMGAQSSPAKLGPFTLSILEGELGPQRKELERLVEFMDEQSRPDVVSLPNLMFIGMARLMREKLGAPVVCELTGEDIFLDALTEPFRSRARQIIRSKVGDVTRFVATSRYYADRMSEYLGVPGDQIDVVYPGITREHLALGEGMRGGRPPTVGFFARICPEKGVDRLIEAFVQLKRMPTMRAARLRIAGYLGPGQRKWFESQRMRLEEAGLDRSVDIVGEVDLAGKLAFMDSIDVLCVPSVYREAKGIYVLEAMARGVPVVKPAHGAFPELIERTGGGVLVEPGNMQALAEGIAVLLGDGEKRQDMGEKARQAVESAFLDDHMAANMLKVYEDCLRLRAAAIAGAS